MQQQRDLEVIYYDTAQGNFPAQEWLEDIEQTASDKLEQLLIRLEQRSLIGTKFLGSLGDDLHYIRIEHRKIWYRLIFFYYGRQAIVCHGFKKKTNEIPDHEKKVARDRMRDFLRRMEAQERARARETVLEKGKRK
jgi:phage-related protein